MYSRNVNGRTLSFGVSGKLWKNALVMYDRETGSLWSHMTGECLDGPLKGETLDMIASTPIVKWKTWRAEHPDTKVLTIRGREDQRRDNYWDYHGSSRTGLFPPEHKDRTLRNKDLVIGVSLNGAQKAYPLSKKHWKTSTKGSWKLIQDTLAGIPILVYHDPDNFTSAVYQRKVGEKTLEFGPETSGLRAADRTGVEWNLLTGRGTDRKRLKPVPHLNVYWFAWVDFYPDASLHGAD